MKDVVIQVENLSKLYRLGNVGRKSLNDDIRRWWLLLRGKEDPYLKIGEENDRTKRGYSDYVWALKDINFEVEQGEVLGIVGRNGAGKSTLMKILSKVTSPTTGVIKTRGRIASLLEVGTGFHPDLTGRDNVFLNGAILGMKKKEIERKFDEIVDFSGVERYIDTPVKRYSSGMYVRLAFSVAAHLEPEILIVDEVLAVGDIEFQKKCLGKMKDVSGHGRTIIFVSHNMTAVKNLCSSVVLMEKGVVVNKGDSMTMVSEYLNANDEERKGQFFETEDDAPGNDYVKMKSIEVRPNPGASEVIFVQTEVEVEFQFWNYVTDKDINLSLQVYTLNEECVFNVTTEARRLSKGLHKGVCYIPGDFLNDNKYVLSMMVVGEKSYSLYNFEKIALFEVYENRESTSWHGKWPGLVRPKFRFSLD